MKQTYDGPSAPESSLYLVYYYLFASVILSVAVYLFT
ncbi:MAG: hypothetical protein UY92_C0004G0007 [Candidatus Magasanikbacteria bacterium GW2011_GWA2_56_11]|uniref:Uncharacterized protein n=1 Tax=Candidatus Magasanikbacteria bacterium GW2011_GWA2_56_11 TaxID=1619044 RepID=A0A0G1YHG8_9BACT|nr:MAG: hypothetical protein UY92_C0004G0007 [Candidatus Magasanikbacteria bacterium GW2011_GWA2_56_11]